MIMKKTLRKPLSLICVIAILVAVSFSIHVSAAGDPTGVLQISYDTATPKHQALSMKVDSVASQSPIQAFCVGWNFTFSNSNGSVEVYVPLSQIDTDGGSRTYVFPMSDGWNIESTGISGAKSIRDKVSNKTLYDNIIKAGCTVHADARIRKYNYSNGTYTPLNTYANSKAEIDSNFSEFSATFRTNTKADYFDLTYTLDPEPIIPPDPTITLIDPPDGLTIYAGQTFTIIGIAKYCKSVDVLINGEVYKTFNCVLDASTGYYQTFNVNTTYTAPKTGDYTVQLIGHGGN